MVTSVHSKEFASIALNISFMRLWMEMICFFSQYWSTHTAFTFISMKQNVIRNAYKESSHIHHRQPEITFEIYDKKTRRQKKSHKWWKNQRHVVRLFSPQSRWWFFFFLFLTEAMLFQIENTVFSSFFLTQRQFKWKPREKRRYRLCGFR